MTLFFKNLIFFLILISIYSCKKDEIPVNSNSNHKDSLSSIGLVAYYPFNGDAKDYSGYENHGFLNGPTLTSDHKGNPNMAYYFGGNNDFINIGNSKLIKRNAADYSVSFWVKIAQHSQNYCSVILSNRNKSNGFGSMIEIAGELSAQFKQVILYKNYNITSDTLTADFVNSVDDLEADEWYHICLTYQYKGGFDNIVKLYIDGIQTSQMTISGANDPEEGFTYIGCEPEMYPIDYSFNGSIDELRIYKRVLSIAEVRSLYLYY